MALAATEKANVCTSVRIRYRKVGNSCCFHGGRTAARGAAGGIRAPGLAASSPTFGDLAVSCTCGNPTKVGGEDNDYAGTASRCDNTCQVKTPSKKRFKSAYIGIRVD